MKTIKSLRAKTRGGITFKNVKRFPSHEWGDEGGCSADMYYNDTLVAHYFNDGEGGMPDIDWLCDINTRLDVDKECLRTLRLRDDSYKTYSFLKSKTPAKVNEDDYFALEELLENEHYRLDRHYKSSDYIRIL